MEMYPDQELSKFNQALVTRDSLNRPCPFRLSLFVAFVTITGDYKRNYKKKQVLTVHKHTVSQGKGKDKRWFTRVDDQKQNTIEG